MTSPGGLVADQATVLLPGRLGLVALALMGVVAVTRELSKRFGR